MGYCCIKALYFSPRSWLLLSSPCSSQSQSVHDGIESMLITKKYVVACGDLNIDMSDLTKPSTKLFHGFLVSHSLIQPISQPTKISESSSSLIDLFLTTHDVSISKSMVLNCAISDHLPMLLDLALPVAKPAVQLSVDHLSISLKLILLMICGLSHGALFNYLMMLTTK